MELETINRLYLELSQFATATTARELRLMETLKACESALRSYQHGKASPDLAEEVADKALTEISKPLPHQS